ncbi:hypothetical protein ACQY0O_004568 [Thecaphora frezii]
MLAELLATLAGHPSSLFSSSSSSLSSVTAAASTLRVRDDVPHLHPAEVQILDHLATYSSRYVRIRSFAHAELDHARRRAIRSAVRDNSLASRPLRSDAASAENPDAQVTTHMVPLCSTLLTLLRSYHDLVLKIERDVLASDAELVADKGFVSLANIRARMQTWDAPLSALDGLVDVLVAGPFGSKRPGFAPPPAPAPVADEPTPAAGPSSLRASTEWTGGLLVDLLSHRATTGVRRVAECMAALRDAVEESWMIGLVAWVCYGLPNPEGGLGSDVSSLNGRGRPSKDQLVEWTQASDQQGDDNVADGHALTEEWGFSTRAWRFRPDALPKSISEATADSILYVGRALNTVRTSTTSSFHQTPGGGTLLPPESMTNQHVALLQRWQSRPSQASGLERAIQEIRMDVSEWLFRNVLTMELVLEALGTLGNYFLQREGTFTVSLLTEIETMRKNKLFHTRSAAAGVIRASDLELALHRASVGTGAEDDPSLEKLRFVLPKGQFRPAAAGKAATASGKAPARFDDLIIGVPAQLHYTATFPLDLFLSPTDLTSYSRLFSYLFSLKRIQSRVLGCWMSLSKSQRIRRRFTGTGEGGVDRGEERRRTELLRRSWGLTRNMLWFLDTLLGHFQTDIIDVQYSRLISQLTGYRGGGGGEGPPTLHRSGSRGSLRRAAAAGLRDRKDSGRSASSLAIEVGEGESGSVTPQSTGMTVYVGSTAGNQTPRASQRGFGSSHFGGGVKRVPFPGSVYHGGGAGAASTYGGGSVAPSHHRFHLRGGGGGASPSVHAPTLHSYRTSGGAALGEAGDEGATLDFTSLRLTHGFFLTFLEDGLLLTSASASNLIRSIVDTCERFVGLVERWGGDVLPSLLSEGGLSSATASSVQNIVAMRRKDVEEIEATLRQRLGEFFRLLNQASSSASSISPPAAATAPAAAGMEGTEGEAESSTDPFRPQQAHAGDVSLVRPRILPPALLGRGKEAGKENKGVNDARVEANVAARRHLEQLLLRLDFNGSFSDVDGR